MSDETTLELEDPEQDPAEGAAEDSAADPQREIPPEEAARLLSGFAAFLRENGAEMDLTVDEIEQTANIARMRLAPAPRAAETAALPEWASEIGHPEVVFVPRTAEEIELWQAEAEPLGKGQSDVVLYYRRLHDKLSPGGTPEEQGIGLDAIHNRFSVDEWEVVVKPILRRYTDALKIQALSRVLSQNTEEAAYKIKKLLPRVFRHEELTEVDVAGREFRVKVNELMNQINTNPNVLKGWIREQLDEGAAEMIAPRVVGKGEDLRKAYAGPQKKQALSRIKSRFAKKGEESLDDYVDELVDRVSHAGEQLLWLNRTHRQGLYEVPPVKADFVETPSMKRVLKQMAEKVDRQLHEKKGMVSIIGDMGTGKNYVVEHFAAKTNRPFFYFPCSRGMDAADLGFHFEFRKGESITVPSNLAKGLQTKNAVILIDEPNALPPEVVAALHGLADHNRSFVYNGVTFKAAEGVTIVMTMNPATYAHVKSLPEAFSDRTLGQDLVMDYPPLTELDRLAQENLWSEAERQQALQSDNELSTRFICDEALILCRQFPEFKAWDDEEFTRLWDVCVNGESEEALGAGKAQLNALRPLVGAMLRIIKIADIWRKKYKKNDMQRTISLRGSIAVADNFRRLGDVRKAFLDLYKPNSYKYDGGPEDYDSVEQVLNDQGELEKTINEAAA